MILHCISNYSLTIPAGARGTPQAAVLSAMGHDMMLDSGFLVVRMIRAAKDTV